MMVVESNDAQAVLLIRTLCDVLHSMTQRLAWLESREATGSWARSIRSEAATLRRDINEARCHIDRLERQYLKRYDHARPSR
jgi:hypothetical protein